LRGVGASTHQEHATSNSSPVTTRNHRLSPEGRARIAAAARKRWAQQRSTQNGSLAKKATPTEKAAQAEKAAPAKKVAKKAKKRVLSAEARKKMALAAKKRWAAQKKQAA
jgi:hypothetical protein